MSLDISTQEDFYRRLQETAVHIETIAELKLRAIAENTWTAWKDSIRERKRKETDFEKVLAWQSGRFRRDKLGVVVAVWLARLEKEKASRLQVRLK